MSGALLAAVSTKACLLVPMNAQADLFADLSCDFSARTSAPLAFIPLSARLCALDKPTSKGLKELFGGIADARANSAPAQFEEFIREVDARCPSDARAEFAWTVEAWGDFARGSLRDLAVKLARDPETSHPLWIRPELWLNGDLALVDEFAFSSDRAKRAALAFALHAGRNPHLAIIRPEVVEALASDKEKHIARDARFAALNFAGNHRDKLTADLRSRMEAVIAQSAEHSMLYADWYLEGRFIAGEAAIAADSITSWSYAASVLRITAQDSEEIAAQFLSITGIPFAFRFDTKASRALERLIRNGAAAGLQLIHAGKLSDEHTAKLESVHSSKFDPVAFAATVTIPADATDEQKESAFLSALINAALPVDSTDDDELNADDDDELAEDDEEALAA